MSHPHNHWYFDLLWFDSWKILVSFVTMVFMFSTITVDNPHSSATVPRYSPVVLPISPSPGSISGRKVWPLSPRNTRKTWLSCNFLWVVCHTTLQTSIMCLFAATWLPILVYFRYSTSFGFIDEAAPFYVYCPGRAFPWVPPSWLFLRLIFVAMMGDNFSILPTLSASSIIMLLGILLYLPFLQMKF